MNELILVRHGYPDHMDNGKTGGWTLSHLTELGRRQAARTGHRLAQMLRGQEFAFYASDLPRAAETAEIIGNVLGQGPHWEPCLREFNNGQAANVTVAEAAKIGIPLGEDPIVDHVWFPGSESWRGLIQRVHACLDRINASAAADRVLVVAHANAGLAAIYWWLDLSPHHWPAIQFEMDLCSITILNHGDFSGRRLLRLNDISHLNGLTK